MEEWCRIDERLFAKRDKGCTDLLVLGGAGQYILVHLPSVGVGRLLVASIAAYIEELEYEIQRLKFSLKNVKDDFEVHSKLNYKLDVAEEVKKHLATIADTVRENVKLPSIEEFRKSGVWFEVNNGVLVKVCSGGVLELLVNDKGKCERLTLSTVRLRNLLVLLLEIYAGVLEDYVQRKLEEIASLEEELKNATEYQRKELEARLRSLSQDLDVNNRLLMNICTVLHLMREYDNI